MNALHYLLLATAISYVASIQLGPVNLRVIQATIEHSRKYALLVGIGGCLPEILYAGLAFYIVELIPDGEFSHNWMLWITIPVFLLLALVNYRKPPQTISLEHKPSPSRGRGFAEGFVLAMLNPQLITFWLLVIASIKSFNKMMSATTLQIWMFLLGCALGALLLQVTFIGLVGRYKMFILKKAGTKVNKIIAALFLLLALIDIFKLVKNSV